MTERKRPHTEEFIETLATNAPRYGVSLSDEEFNHFQEYFEHLTAWNARYHLVAPCPPREFAVRHVLESLTALPFLSSGATIVDVGSGAGLPIIPCLIARPDVTAVLVEASPKKTIFLREALRRVERQTNARVVAERFESIPPPAADVVTCRALERFTEWLPTLVKWAANVKTLLLFGGLTLGERIESLSLPHQAILLPDSEGRFLYVIEHANDGAEARSSERTSTVGH